MPPPDRLARVLLGVLGVSEILLTMWMVLAAGVFDAVSLAAVALLLGWTFLALERSPA